MKGVRQKHYRMACALVQCGGLQKRQIDGLAVVLSIVAKDAKEEALAEFMAGNPSCKLTGSESPNKALESATPPSEKSEAKPHPE